MALKDIKVIVADDSGLMRLIISDIINSEEGMKVVDTAEDGRDATKKCLKQEVDVLVLDMNMGTFGGTYAVEHILKKKNVPILILSALGNSNMEPILDALRLGAVDYINKPDRNKTRVREIADKIIRKVRSVAVTNRRQIAASKKTIKINQEEHTFRGKLNYDVIVIGASTGGPTAVERIVSKLPSNLPVPVIVAQHMPANFVPSFANRLNTLTPLEVSIGRKDDVLLPGKVIIASGSRNSIVRRNERGEVVIDYVYKRFTEFNHPSINGLFLSVADVYGKRSIAAILTGMGKDGANGMDKIFNNGGYTIGQNEETSVVYGMPREVAQRGIIKQAVSIYEMAGFIVSCLG
jgi:two-component system chemotaxis response regulator CheB